MAKKLLLIMGLLAALSPAVLACDEVADVSAEDPGGTLSVGDTPPVRPETPVESADESPTTS